MRLALFGLLAFTAAASAQGAYLPVGERGYGVSVGTTFNDGDVRDGTAALVATVTPRLDLSAAVSAFELGSRTGRSVAVGAAVYLEADGPTRTAATASVGRTTGDLPEATAVSVGAFAARHVVRGAFVVVPRVAIAVGTAFGDRVDGGIQTSAAVDVAVQTGGAGARVYVAPGVTLDSEAQRFFPSVRIGALLF